MKFILVCVSLGRNFIYLFFLIHEEILFLKFFPGGLFTILFYMLPSKVAIHPTSRLPSRLPVAASLAAMAAWRTKARLSKVVVEERRLEVRGMGRARVAGARRRAAVDWRL